MKLTKLQFWGLIVNLLLLILIGVAYSYMNWQKNLFNLEKVKINDETAQNKAKIELLKHQLQSLTSEQTRSDYLLPFFGSHQEIYEFFAATAKRSNLTINRLSLRDGDEHHLKVPVEIELSGDYSSVETFFDRMWRRNFKFQLDRIELVQNPEPDYNLRLIFTIFIPTRTEEING
jgi:Tfp pilus assembly protein PilO